MLIEKEAMSLKQNKEQYIGELGGKKGKGEMMWLYYNLKNKGTKTGEYQNGLHFRK